MEACLLVDFKEGKVLRDGIEEVFPWDELPIGDRIFNFRNPKKGEPHFVCFCKKDKKRIYTQYIKDGHSYCLGPESGWEVLNLIKKILRSYNIAPYRLELANEAVECKNTIEEKDNNLIETRHISDGKMRLIKKHQKKSINSYLCNIEFVLTGYTYIVSQTRSVIKGQVTDMINKIIINQPDPSVLEYILKSLSLISAGQEKTKALE